MKPVNRLLVISAALFVVSCAKAQTIFTYGTYDVSKAEFEKALNKNPDTSGNRADNVKQYLNLYINFKLKLQAAYDEKLNNNEELKNEAANFRDQLTDNYINQQANLAQLVREAFNRSQKDMEVQQVFVEATKNDTAAAFEIINKAFKDLQSGKDFNKVSKQYSTDSATKANEGNIGFITVFTLPYEMENVVYNTAPGSYSNIYHSKVGYHIFKTVSERPAAGMRKIQQMIFITPDFFTNEQIKDAKERADSVYNAIQNGTQFASLLPMYGANYSNYQEANNIDVTVGEYDHDFEQQVFALSKPGDVSKPFKTSYGYNIIKLLDVAPANKNEDDIVAMGNLQTKVQNDNRLNIAKDKLYQSWFTQTGFKENDYSKTDLFAYTDTAINAGNEPPASYKKLTPQTVLFQFTKQKLTVDDWLNYVRANLEPGAGKDAFPGLLNDFKKSACSNYYSNHIEDFYPAAPDQLKEFNDANLLFAAMDKHVWNKAAQDSAGLLKYYNTHKEKYTWQPGVSALVISATDESILIDVATKIKQQPADWHNIIASYNDQLNADSNRFESGQLPVKSAVVMQKDFQSAVEKNESGDGFVFIHIYDVYTNSSPRNFEDARGMVMNDYQEELEQQWLAELKKKYPVKVNESVVAAVK